MQGKVILVTGGAKRVGAAICRRLHAQGARLVVHYRSSFDEAKVLQDELNRKRSDSAALVQADLLDTELLPDLVEKAAGRFGQLDVLINNASSFFPTLLQQCTLADWHDLIGSNLQAPLFLAQAAAPYLKEQNGCVVNIVDIHTERPLKNYVIYNAAKGGLLALEAQVGALRDTFMKKGVQMLVDGSDPEALRVALELELDVYEEEQRRAAKIWDAAGGYAPTIGILGAVMGLIHVMENLSDPSKLGGGIAVAFVATIYGVGSANLLFLPIANKIKMHIEAQVKLKSMFIEGLVGIGNGDNPRIIESRLQGFIG